MKVAVFTGTDEVLVLPVKGKSEEPDCIDGFHKFFSTKYGDDRARYVGDYGVQLYHIGAGDALVITNHIKSDAFEKCGKNIEHWFDTED